MIGLSLAGSTTVEFSRWSKRRAAKPRAGSRSGLSIIRPLLAVLALGFLVAPASAQQGVEVDADFASYCSAAFPGTEHDWVGTTHYCRQGRPGRDAVRHDVDLAEACRMTNGQPGFRRVGRQVVCTGLGDTELASDKGPPDFEAYCRETTASGAYEQRAERWGIAHYCRLPGATGGFTLQEIDLAEACRITRGADSFDSSGGRIRCVDSVDPIAEAEPQGEPGTAEGPGPRRPRDVPPDEVTEIDPPDVPAPDPQVPPNPVPVDDTETPVDSLDRLELACQALGGAWQDGTVPLVEAIVGDMQESIGARTPQCSAPTGLQGAEANLYCEPAVMVEESMKAYFQVMMIYQCHVALISDEELGLPDHRRAARDEGCEIEKRLEDIASIANSNGGNIDSSAQVRGLRDMWSVAEFCDREIMEGET